jgi:hypothetical protein
MPNPGLDINALLSNPAILQALHSQLASSNSGSTAIESPQEWRPEEDGALEGNSTPGQTTRFGRVSRPPVAVPAQSQLALLQQMLRSTAETDSTALPSNSLPSGSRRQAAHGAEAERGTRSSSSSNAHVHPQAQFQSRQNAPTPVPSARNGIKRPHSTLRESSVPPRSISPELRSRETSEEQLVRPVQPTQSWGRPRKGDLQTKEERAQRRKINNQHSGMFSSGEMREVADADC